ncbi:MAG: hypothetical protein R3C09_13815 [Pirellulaceae bacterium]
MPVAAWYVASSVGSDESSLPLLSWISWRHAITADGLLFDPADANILDAGMSTSVSGSAAGGEWLMAIYFGDSRLLPADAGG